MRNIITALFHMTFSIELWRGMQPVNSWNYRELLVDQCDDNCLSSMPNYQQYISTLDQLLPLRGYWVHCTRLSANTVLICFINTQNIFCYKDIQVNSSLVELWTRIKNCRSIIRVISNKRMFVTYVTRLLNKNITEFSDDDVHDGHNISQTWHSRLIRDRPNHLRNGQPYFCGRHQTVNFFTWRPYEKKADRP